MLHAVRVETIDGQPVTLRIRIPASEHPDLVELQGRIHAMPYAPNVMSLSTDPESLLD